MKSPIAFIYRNLVFRDGLDDVWAVYRIATRSYAGLPLTSKREVMAELTSMAYGLETDFALLRVARQWDVESYVRGVWAGCDRRHAQRPLMQEYLGRQQGRLEHRGAYVPEVYLAARLPPRDRRWTFGRGAAGDALTRALGLSDPRSISGKRLTELIKGEQSLSHRLLDYADAEPAASHELRWLIARAFCRGLGEPLADERFLPQALVVDPAGDDSEPVFEPLQADVLRLSDAPVNVDARHLRIEAEAGDSYQALLCVGALPDVVVFPGRQAELLFAPLEALDFPVDAAFIARHVPNPDAVRLVRRKLVDADYAYDEETRGYHGPSSNTAGRPAEVRELEQYLTSTDHPPLLHATISLAVGAPTSEVLEDRVAQLRREFGSVKLHRPLGQQLGLFVAHLPAQSAPGSDYDDYLTVEQFGAMVPTATHAVGAETGLCIGNTLNGARQPVLFDVAEACRTSRSPATLLAGTLGSGKTLCMELMMYQAFLAGSAVCDIDPKGDHRLEQLPGVADQMEVIELAADERCRGMLDPLRIGPEETREDLACQFLLGILPEPSPPRWHTEIRLAVQKTVANNGRCCGEIVEELSRGTEDAQAAGRALAIHASSGLARLGFAQPGSAFEEPGQRPVTSIRIRNLTLPLPGTPRADLLEEERLGRAILHLLAVYALRLTSHDRDRHAVLGFDEAWVLLSDSSGRALVDRISRLGRAQNVTPLLATQALGDVDELDSIIGAAFCFGVESEREARAALRLLRLDEDDRDLQQRMLAFRRGRCLMRDYQGRVSTMQVDLLDPELLRALDTTPGVKPEPAEWDQPHGAGEWHLRGVADELGSSQK